MGEVHLQILDEFSNKNEKNLFFFSSYFAYRITPCTVMLLDLRHPVYSFTKKMMNTMHRLKHPVDR